MNPSANAICHPGGSVDPTARILIWRQDVNIHPSFDVRTDFDDIDLFDVFRVTVSCQNEAFVLFLIRVPQLSSLGVEGTRATTCQRLNITIAIIRYILVRFSQQTLQTQQNTLHVVHRTPLVLQDIQTNAAGEVDIGVVDGSFVEDGRWRVRIVAREGKRKLQREAFIGSLCRTGDGCCPGKKVAVCVREGRDSGGWREHELHQFCLEAARSQFPYFIFET